MSEGTIIFVNGIHRSGTTLLSRLINALPGVYLVTDGIRIPWLYLQVERIKPVVYPSDMERRKKWPMDLNKNVRDAKKFQEILNKEVSDLALRPEVDCQVRAVVNAVDGSQSYREVFRDLFASLAQAAGVRAVGSKNTHMSHYRGEILEAFANARWIEVVRDPRGWYCSARISHKQEILRAARDWNRCYRGYVREDLVGRERTLLMSFEDLIVRRSGALNDVAKFLGLEFRVSEEWLRNIRLVDNDGRQWHANSSFDKASGQALTHEEIFSREPRDYDILDEVPAFRWRTELTQVEKFLMMALTFPTRRRLGLPFGVNLSNARRHQ